MKYKMTFAAGAVTGYVLGTRAGRERYEQIRAAARRFLESPKAQQAKEQARAQAGELAGMARGKADELAAKAKGQAGRLKEAARSKAESMPGMSRHAGEHAMDGTPQRSTVGKGTPTP